MATKSRRRLSDQEREERRERGRQQLMQATEQLLSSDGWQRWVRVRSRNGLSRYSINNQLIIALSKPEASYVCGFRAWLQLGYQVRRGEKAIWILAKRALSHRMRSLAVAASVHLGGSVTRAAARLSWESPADSEECG
ncbi:MAG: ArdC family protein, partial [Steroidobacteraceae bacterium]